MDIPAIHLVRSDATAEESSTPTLSDALDLYLKLKGVGKDKVFVRTATRNVEYVVKAWVIDPLSNTHLLMLLYSETG